MAEIRRTLFLHPKSGGQFDLVLQSSDLIGHSAFTTLSGEAYDELEALITKTSVQASQIIRDHTDWDRIGK